MSEAEVILSSGNVNSGMVQVGNTVRRRTTPASPAVHRRLLHLEQKGGSSSPRFLGLDEQGREILPFLEGKTEMLRRWESCAETVAKVGSYARTLSELWRQGEQDR
jgi:hypothetical protein